MWRGCFQFAVFLFCFFWCHFCLSQVSWTVSDGSDELGFSLGVWQSEYGRGGFNPGFCDRVSARRAWPGIQSPGCPLPLLLCKAGDLLAGPTRFPAPAYTSGPLHCKDLLQAPGNVWSVNNGGDTWPTFCYVLWSFIDLVKFPLWLTYNYSQWLLFTPLTINFTLMFSFFTWSEKGQV